MAMKNDLDYTSPELVKDLLAITPILPEHSVLDAGSGKNKIWYNTITNKDKYECEIEDGNDFFNWTKPVDWIVGNPPFRSNQEPRKNLIAPWIEHSSEIAQIGMAFLLNHQVFNALTPKRLQLISNKDFNIKKVHIINCKRWFGRYYWIVWDKNITNNIFSWTFSWETKTYD